MIHWNLFDYYSFVDQMMEAHKYTKTEIDEMIPFEREIFVFLIKSRLPAQVEMPSAPTEF